MGRILSNNDEHANAIFSIYSQTNKIEPYEVYRTTLISVAQNED